MKNEEWRYIPGYEDRYQVSNLGNVRSVDRYVEQFGHKNSYKRLMKGRTLILRRQRGGYLLATLTRGGKEKKETVHRLIALTFIPNPLNKEQVNHKDGNKQNNRVENLEWCTQSENQKHCYDILNHKRNGKKVMCIELNRKFNSIV